MCPTNRCTGIDTDSLHVQRAVFYILRCAYPHKSLNLIAHLWDCHMASQHQVSETKTLQLRFAKKALLLNPSRCSFTESSKLAAIGVLILNATIIINAGSPINRSHNYFNQQGG